jgi:toxin ParE1/3/4
MGYKILFSVRAEEEFNNAHDYYIEKSFQAGENFSDRFIEAINKLDKNPYQRLRYKDVRSIKLEKYPFTLFYQFNEEKGSIKILSCFHDKRNPKNQP